MRTRGGRVAGAHHMAMLPLRLPPLLFMLLRAAPTRADAPDRRPISHGYTDMDIEWYARRGPVLDDFRLTAGDGHAYYEWLREQVSEDAGAPTELQTPNGCDPGSHPIDRDTARAWHECVPESEVLDASRARFVADPEAGLPGALFT